MQAAQNYIYIVFAVLYIIYSIVKAVRENKQQQPGTPQKSGSPAQPVRPPVSSPVPAPGDEIKKMLEDLLGGNPEVKVPEKQMAKPGPLQRSLSGQPVSSKPVPAKIVPKHPPKEKLTSQPAKPLASKPAMKAESVHFTSHPEIVQQVFSAPEEKEEETPVDFDIRQAVLYAEILKRPQY